MKLINKMIETKELENYDDENLKALDEHIEKQSKQVKPSYRMVEVHTGPTKVTLSEQSMKALAKKVMKL